MSPGHIASATLPAGFVAPYVPTKTHTLPFGAAWIHEIKHDGLCIIARKDGRRFRLSSRPSEHCEGSDTSAATFRNCLEDRLQDLLFGSTEYAEVNGSR